MKRWQNNLYMVGLLLIEAIIMLNAVPKANADEISMKISLGIALFLAILVSLALLVKGNQGNYKAIIPIFIVCVATYIQILYCAAFYSWGASVCMTLPIFQLILGYAIFRYSNYNRQNEKCNFEKRKVHFLVFSGHFGRVCLTAVQSSLKRCLIG